MESLKSAIPSHLKSIISESSASDLPYTCSSLLDFFHQHPQFHQVVEDFTGRETALCGKNKDAALEAKQKGNECFSKGDYLNALSFYSQALCVSPANATEMDKSLLAMLYLNRAAVLHKQSLLVECLRDCNRALVICPTYAKAWYRKGKANAAYGNYDNAIHDLEIAIIMETSTGGKRQIQTELKLVLGQHKEKNSSSNKDNKEILDFLDERNNIELHSVYSPSKGRGMVSSVDIPQSSLIHTEEPYAAVILKNCRQTHCHFCFNELPADMVFCLSCSTPSYCSEECHVKASGQKTENCSTIHADVPSHLEKYFSDITSPGVINLNTEHFSEHKHECEGVNWPAVLPPDIVLAGRIFIKSLMQQIYSGGESSSLAVNLDLCHNYAEITAESKLELHIKSIILLHCLRNAYTEVQINGATLSQCVMLLNQIKINSMAIVRLKSFDVNNPLAQSGMSSFGDASTSSVEQIRVGQAMYLAGSLFNHSCKPNIHIYFLSRNLYIRSTEFVLSGEPLELSYGPQVGQWDRKDRQHFLQDQYSFKCECSGCSDLNLSDLALNAFRCIKPDCSGSILDSYIKVNKLENDDVSKVARHLFESNQLGPGYCLNCGSYRDIELLTATTNKAYKTISRLERAIVCNEFKTDTIPDALKSLKVLRATLHAYNKRIAEVEDKIAESFCLVGDLRPIISHCKASIEILENLYGEDHIVIGNELMKLASIQLLKNQHDDALKNINRADSIFSVYYGSHVDLLIPHLKSLKLQLTAT